VHNNNSYIAGWLISKSSEIIVINSLVRLLGRTTRHFFVIAIGACASSAFAALGTSVTLVSGDPSSIYPSQTTSLHITLSNSNTSAAITGIAFSNSLPGSLPDGLKIAGPATYACTDPSGPSTSPGVGVLTANLNTQAISLSGGSIPARANNIDGTCTIVIPVTAGTSTGNAATYTYSILDGAVTGNDGATVANSGNVSQSINVSALTRPTITKFFSNSTAILGGASRTLTLTLTNANPVDIPNFSVADVFPQLGGTGIIKVAATPAATAICNNGGSAPSFTPVAGATSISATGTIPARSGATNGSCTLTVAIEGNHTYGAYTTGAQTNSINASSQFNNDIGIPAAANANADITVTAPLSVAKAFSPALLAEGQNGSVTITLSNTGDAALTVTSFDDNPIDGIGNADNTKGLLVTGVATSCAGGVASVLQTSGHDRGVRLSGGTIPAGGSCTVTANFTATTQAANTPITYTNSIPEGAVGITVPGIVSQRRSATILVADTLRILKANNANSPRPGNPVQYAITVQNWSTSDMSNVRVLDSLENSMSYLTGTINGINYTPTLSGTGCSGLSTGNATGDASLTFVIATVPQRTGPSTPGACTISFYAMASTAAANGSSSVNNIAAGAVCTNNGAGICNGEATASGNRAVNTTVLSATKAFSPAGPLSEGSVSRMTISLSNFSVNPLTAVSISDTLPIAGTAQMRIADPPNAATTCGSGSITAVAGTSSVALNGGTVPARASIGTGAAGTCSLQVDVIAAAGAYNNTATIAGNETYANGTTHGVNATANANITYTSALAATKSFFPAAVSSGGRSTVTLRLSNTGTTALTNVAVSDPLPTGMVVADPVKAHTTCAGATTINMTAGASTAGMTGAAIAAGGVCKLVFDVTATGTANWVNTIPAGNITADGGVKNQAAVVGTLNYQAPTSLSVAKATNPSTLTFPGQVSALTITITNGTQAVTNLSLTDYFTTDGTTGAAANGMVIAPTPAAATTCPAGLVYAMPGGTSVALTGASMAASTSCTITVNVTSSAVGGITNYIPAGALTNDQGLSNIGQASTSLTTQANIGITKQFIPNVIKPGERSRLRIIFYNPTATPMSNVGVLDTLPAGVTVPSGANPTTTCGGASVTSPANNQIQVSNGTIPAASSGIAASCIAEIDVNAATQGDYVNTIAAGSVTALSGGVAVTNSQPATDTLRVKLPLVVHEAISGRTLDAGNPAGFTTGSASSTTGTHVTLTIRLDNPNNVPLTSASFIDALPAGLVVTPTPNASTTCAGGTVTAAPSSTGLRLTGATIPAAGFCVVTVDVLSNIPGNYIDSIGAGSISTFEGVSNEEPTSAELIIATPPTISKQFSPAVIPPNGTSTLTIFLGNPNSTAVTLSSILTDTLPTAPGNLIVAAIPNITKTCPGAVTAAAGSNTISYANGASIPAGGCTISVNVTAVTPGTHNNNIPAGALQTSAGNNHAAANASLLVSTQGYLSGKVFRDNNVTPNGTFEAGTDTPIQGVSIELRSGANCSGALLASTTTDVLGNYLFSGLAGGLYSVCEPIQPTGTSNGITTAGAINGINGSTGTSGSVSNPTATTSQIVNVVLNADGAGGEISGSAGNNFAETVLSSISGVVFLDQNNNGIQNGGDSGIGGVTLQLLDSGNTVIATTLTDASGNYSFTALQPGTYSVRQPTQPSGTSNGITMPGAVANGGTPGTASGVTVLPSLIASIVLPPNTAANSNNFAEIQNGRTISGVAFLDFDNSGTLNGNDHGIGGEMISLSGTDVNGNAVTRSTTTASDGSYSFTGLPEGTYTISQTSQATGTTNGISTAGSTGGVASNPTATSSRISAVNLTGSNTVSAENNFAEIPGAAPDLAIAKTHAPTSFAQGGATGYYNIVPSNIGTVPTSGTITVVDAVPAGMTPTTASGSGWTCGIAGQVVTCNSTTPIAASSTGNPITLNVSVGLGLSGQVLTNTATISGGGEPAGFTGNNSVIDPTAVSGAASVAGNVWRDLDHDRVLDAGEPLVSAWRVDLHLGGVLVATTQTDNSGHYAFNNLAPGSGYEIRFREPTTGAIFGHPVPNESGAAFTNGITGAGNPAGASNASGTLTGLTLVAGSNVVEQSLPLDPAGVVYDAISRAPVAGAVVTLSGPTGLTAADVVGGSLSQTTGADGFYQFLLNPSAPSGVYTLTVTTYPPSYVPQPSTLIPVCANTPTVGALPNPALVQNSNTAPASATPLHNTATCPAASGTFAGGAGTTQYYASFNMIIGTSTNMVNNHIPLDPILGGAIVISKTTPLVNVARGDLVPYTITATNTLSATLPNIDVVDRIPPGFRYRTGSATLNAVPSEPTINGRQLTWRNQSFTPNERKIIKLILIVGAGVSEGEYPNLAWAMNNVAAAQVSNTANATVRVIPDPTFDCSDIIGKVFDDKNANGWQDEGEPGIPNVRVVTARGLLVTTDAEGRFHVACAAIPQADHGANFVMKLDERTLPTGYRVTTENPRDVRVTRGKMVKLNFGATVHRVVRLELEGAAFVGESVELAPDWAAQVAVLPEKLKERPSVLRIAYRLGSEAADIGRRRVDAMAEKIRSLWKERSKNDERPYPLVIETELEGVK
jgi:uncharacterized repeat protein (TIGR01451 family)